jgi:hypothetical protein
MHNQRFSVDAADEDQSCAPPFWIYKWFDDSGNLLYELGNGSFGALYTDNTKMTLDPTGKWVLY